jgi:uncharacterized protein YceK
MLFPSNALASRPQAWFWAEKKSSETKGGKVIKILDLPASFLIKGQSMQLRL